MLKNYCLIISLLVLTSCAINPIHYTYNFKTIQKGIDFKQSDGLWAINTVNIPEHREDRRANNILAQFNKWTNNKATLLKNATDKENKRFLLHVTKNVEKEQFRILKEATNYKYLVNIFITKNEQDYKQHVAEMMFDIYDVTEGKLVVSESVIGSVSLEKNSTKNNEKVHITDFLPPLTSDMIKGLIEKGLKKISENSKY